MKPKKISIRWNLFSYFVLFSIIMLILLWVFQIVLLNDFYKSIKINELKSYSAELSKNINTISFNTELEQTLAEKEMCLSLFSENGTLLYSCNTIRNCAIHKMPQHLVFQIATDALNQNNNYIDLKSKPLYNFQNNILCVKKIKTTSFGNCILILNSSIMPVSATVTTLRTQLLYITIIMIILSLILSFSLAKKLSTPIININDKAKKFAEGNYNIKFEDNNYSEVSELSDTLNYASSELSKVEKLRRELIANISHDLRTPLTMITGYSEVMRDLPNENTPENIQIIIDETKRLTTLVNDVLDISKIQSGAQTLNISECNLTQLINSILLRYTKLTKKDGYSITFEKNEENLIIKCDELRLTQVIYNLINNAITYTGNDKKIIIRQIKKENSIRIEVSDTGNGIAEENLPYIWDRYYKITGEHKRAQIGTGLGLSIVKEVLELHQFKYGVTSKTNEGSTFWFEIPN